MGLPGWWLMSWEHLVAQHWGLWGHPRDTASLNMKPAQDRGMETKPSSTFELLDPAGPRLLFTWANIALFFFF